MIRNVWTKAVPVVLACAMLPLSVFAAEPGAVQYMTSKEYMSLCQSVSADAESQKTLVATIGPLSVYKSDVARPVAKYDKATGLYEVTFRDDIGAYTVSDSSGTFTISKSGYAAVGFSGDDGDEFHAVRDVMDSLGLYSFYYTSILSRIYSVEDGKIQLSPEGLCEAYVNEQKFQITFLPELETYVSSGMTVKEAAYGTARYVSDKLSYDHSMAKTKDSLSAGIGVCYHYAADFYSLMREIPFSSDGFVDWSNGQRGYADVYYFESTNHAWNGVNYDGSIHYFDATWYDTQKDSRWLDMGAAEQSDFSHTIRLVR